MTSNSRESGRRHLLPLENKYGEAARAKQTELYHEFSTAYTIRRRSLQDHRTVARLALKSETNHFQALGLDKPLAAGLTGWISQAETFYDNALAEGDIVAKLAVFGLNEADLWESLDAVILIADLHSARLEALEENIRATVNMNQDIGMTKSIEALTHLPRRGSIQGEAAEGELAED